MMVQVQYQQLSGSAQLPLQLPVFLGQNSITLFDDGTNGDPIAMDGIYTGTLSESPQDFESDMNARVQAINSQTQQGIPFFTFAGHLGTQVSSQQVSQQLTFDMNAFNSFAPVSLSPLLFSPAAAAMAPSSTCVLPAIIKQQSLFITDLSVVEDPARTYNVVTGIGNPVGNWTFGTMINNMTGGLVTPSALLLSWFNNYVIPVVVNFQTINARGNFVYFVIAPWMVAAGAAPNRAAVTPANWLAIWNTVPAATLLKTAPFKLTAIVNRMDLRGNPGYSGGLSNAGETRFIFTLIDPNLGDGPGPNGLGVGSNGFITGLPPIQPQNEFFPGTNFIDWKGFNIIFEYGNVQNNLCSVVNFANQWVNLSTFAFPSAAYNAALEAITTTVTNMGAAPTKVNKSAINRIRTNERICDKAVFASIPSWVTSDWEFRQFELQTASNLFAQVPLTNTPMNSANDITAASITINPLAVGSLPTIAAVPADQDNLMDWIFSTPANVANIIAGNVSIPTTWLGSPLLSGGARVDYEFLHYIDLNWASTDANFVAYKIANTLGTVNGFSQYKLVRQQLSVNSCQGCHAADTKTIFTQVEPLGYGVPARYWNSPPDVTTAPGGIDTRFVTKVGGAYATPPPTEDVVNVSAFLTGRNFRVAGGLCAPISKWYDDLCGDEPSDPTMNGLFWVNAQDNYPGNAINLNTYLFGYNDLQRRLQDLQLIACTNCALMKTTPLLQILIGVPMPLGGH